MDVFISYSRKDKAVAETLATALESAGCVVWWDSDLKPGDDFAEIINTALNKVSSVIVIWSPDSIMSHWVKSEAAFALEARKLISLTVRDPAIPMPFDMIHHMAVDDLNTDDPRLETILQTVAAYREGRGDVVSLDPKLGKKRNFIRRFARELIFVGAALTVIAALTVTSAGSNGTDRDTQAAAFARVLATSETIAGEGAREPDLLAIQRVVSRMSQSGLSSDRAVLSLLQSGDIRAAIKQMQSDFEAKRDTLDQGETVQALQEIGTLAFDAMPNLSQTMFEESLRLSPDDVYANIQLGRLLRRRGDTNLARQRFARASANQTFEPKSREDLYLKLDFFSLLLYQSADDRRRALERLEDTATSAQDAGFDKIAAQATIRMAIALATTGEYAEAERLIDTAMPSLRSGGQEPILSIAYGILGKAARIQGKLDKAYRISMLYRETEVALNRQEGVAGADIELARVDTLREDYAASQEKLDGVFAYLKTTDLPNMDLLAHVAQAELLMRTDKWQTACAEIRQAEIRNPNLPNASHDLILDLETLGCGFAPLNIKASRPIAEPT
ncbi:MAG: TIR domain-containing protein [Pseudomonadota bacterium]